MWEGRKEDGRRRGKEEKEEEKKRGRLYNAANTC